MPDFADLRTRAVEIREEVGVSKNTARRVGQFLIDLLSYIEGKSGGDIDGDNIYSGEPHIVTNPIGDFQNGESLKGVSYNTIFQRLLCPDTSVLELPSIESLSVNESELQATGRIAVTINQSLGSGLPTHYAVSESQSGLTAWKQFAETFIYQFASEGKKTIYVKLKNDQGQSNIKSATVTYGTVSSSKMYLGYIELGDVSNSAEIITAGFSRIKETDLLQAPNITEYDLGAKTFPISIPGGSIMFFAIPNDSVYKVTKDNGFGGHVPFSSGSGQSFLESNGDKVITISGTSYRMYGEDANVAGERTIYVESK